MMLVCSSGKDCQIRKDWPSQRCPDFKLCQGYVIEKRIKHRSYEHMGDAKDFLERCLIGVIPLELIQLVYEYFGSGTVVFDGDKVLLMPKINKQMELPFMYWIIAPPDRLHHYKTLVSNWKLLRICGRQVIRTIHLACMSDNNIVMKIDYEAINSYGDHQLTLKWNFNGNCNKSETIYVFPCRSHELFELNQLFVDKKGYTNTFDWWLNFNGLADHYSDNDS